MLPPAQALSDFFKAACKTDQTSPLALDSVQLFALSINAARVELSSLWIAVASNFPSQIISGPDSKGTSQDFGAYASGVTACIETVTQALPSTESMYSDVQTIRLTCCQAQSICAEQLWRLNPTSFKPSCP